MRKYLLKKDAEDLRDHHFKSSHYPTAASLPQMVDLRPFCSPVVDQGSLGSCTANAIASGLREYLAIRAGQSFVPLSRLFLYYEERVLENTVDQDSGAEIRDGMKVLTQLGVCPETDDPYDISQFTIAPKQQALQDAGLYKISTYGRITNLNMLKVALAKSLPVVLGINIYESFESTSVASTGKVPIPQKREALLGGHAVLAVGYYDTTPTSGYLIVRNSWGEAWGDHGYFYLRYPVFKKLVLDMWTGR
jgi:C1A family cysteine protease